VLIFVFSTKSTPPQFTSSPWIAENYREYFAHTAAAERAAAFLRVLWGRRTYVGEPIGLRLALGVATLLA
jgi:hypothetical protein